jgi:hypothetical protein
MICPSLVPQTSVPTIKKGLFVFTGVIRNVKTKIVRELYMEEAACEILVSIK